MRHPLPREPKADGTMVRRSRWRIGFLSVLSLLVAPAFLSASSPADTIPQAPGEWESEILREHPLVGVLLNLRDGSQATPEALIREAMEARHILLGEVHDNPDHHLLQSWVVEAMGAGGARPAVVFEMIREDRADALDEHLQRKPGDAERLGDAVGWEEEGWPDWSLYEPIAEVAIGLGLQIRPGNVTRREQQSVSREGLDALSPGRRSELALDRPLPPKKEAALEEELIRAHCGYLPEEAVPVVADVQRLRDGAMAAHLIEAADRSPGSQAVLIAGRGHVRADRGVPWYLRERGDGDRVLTVGLVQVEEGREVPEDYFSERLDSGPLPYDYLWFTPRPHDRDFCAELEERMRRGG